MEKKHDIKEAGNKKPGIKDIVRMSISFTEGILNQKAQGVTSVHSEDEEWNVNVEMLERRAVPDTQDILSTYELKLTCDGDVTGYKRTSMRKRGDRVREAVE